MTDSSSWRPGIRIREFRSATALCLLLFLMLCSVALLLNAKTKEKDDVQWMTSEEAFDSSHNGNPPDSGMIRKVVIDASYEEAFHAASVAATQAMWDVDKQDKTAGVLLAHRIVDEPLGKVFPDGPQGGTRYGVPGRHLYFYRMKANELSAKQTELVLGGRAQGYCGLLGSPPTLSVKAYKSEWAEYNQKCGELRAGMWLNANDQPEISQFVVLLRNNLIAAGGGE